MLHSDGMQVECATEALNAPAGIYARVFREFRPRTPLPEIRVEVRKYANANAQVATTASQIPVLETSAQQTIYALSVLLAQPPAALLQELSATQPLPITPPEVPVGLPSELRRRRPDIHQAEAQIHAATAQIGVATADLFPKFSLTGSLTFGWIALIRHSMQDFSH